MRAHAQHEPLAPHQLQVAIIGAGATGVELSAELHRSDARAGRLRARPHRPRAGPALHLIEAADARAAGPARAPVGGHARQLLRRAGRAGAYRARRSRKSRTAACSLADGRRIAAELVVWAAGVKAADFLKRRSTGWRPTASTSSSCGPRCRPRATTTSSRIGDCAACPWPDAAERQGRHRAAACAGRAPAGLADGQADAAPARRQARSPTTATATSVRWSRWASSARWAT